MSEKRFLKRMLSMICSVSILTLSLIPTSFAADENTNIASGDGYTYEIEWKNDKDFVLTGFVDGEAFDRVSGSIGGEYITWENFSQSDSPSNINDSELSYIKVSDIIAPAESVGTFEPSITPMRYSQQAGSLQYRVLLDKYYYHTIYVDYEIVGVAEVSDYELHADANMSLSVLIGSILTVTGVRMGVGILATIIGTMGGVVSNGTVLKGFFGYFSGTQYDYNVGAENRAVYPIARREYSGRAFDGRIRKGNGPWQTGQKAYEGYYPQFIREKDTAVATWVFNDFFSGTFDVNSWDSKI